MSNVKVNASIMQIVTERMQLFRQGSFTSGSVSQKYRPFCAVTRPRIFFIIGPISIHEILLLIAYAGSECSKESVHLIRTVSQEHSLFAYTM